MEKLDRHSPIPLYHQLVELLKQEIAADIYRPGDRIPSEGELMSEVGVSRTTVRLALKALENEGLVRREQGRGTFVATPRIRSQFPALLSFSQEVEQMGYRPGTVLLDVTESLIPPSVEAYLGLQPGQPALRVVRMRTADSQPIALTTSWLNLVEFPKLRDLDYTQLSLYTLFEEESELIIVRAIQRILADLATEREAEVLAVSFGSPVVRLSRTTYVAGEREGGVPIEHVDAVFNGGMYSVETELCRGGDQRHHTLYL